MMVYWRRGASGTDTTAREDGMLQTDQDEEGEQGGHTRRTCGKKLFARGGGLLQG